jgi:hypothetical protein
VFTFAPKEDQLRLYIWKEIGKLWPRFQAPFPGAAHRPHDPHARRHRRLVGRARLRGRREGRRETSTKAQGMHAAHMLLVYEETPGIPLPVLEAGENTCDRAAQHPARGRQPRPPARRAAPVRPRPVRLRAAGREGDPDLGARSPEPRERRTRTSSPARRRGSPSGAGARSTARRPALQVAHPRHLAGRGGRGAHQARMGAGRAEAVARRDAARGAHRGEARRSASTSPTRRTATRARSRAARAPSASKSSRSPARTRTTSASGCTSR